MYIYCTHDLMYSLLMSTVATKGFCVVTVSTIWCPKFLDTLNPDLAFKSHMNSQDYVIFIIAKLNK